MVMNLKISDVILFDLHFDKELPKFDLNKFVNYTDVMAVFETWKGFSLIVPSISYKTNGIFEHINKILGEHLDIYPGMTTFIEYVLNDSHIKVSVNLVENTCPSPEK